MSCKINYRREFVSFYSLQDVGLNDIISRVFFVVCRGSALKFWWNLFWYSSGNPDGILLGITPDIPKMIIGNSNQVYLNSSFRESLLGFSHIIPPLIFFFWNLFENFSWNFFIMFPLNSFEDFLRISSGILLNIPPGIPLLIFPACLKRTILRFDQEFFQGLFEKKNRLGVLQWFFRNFIHSSSRNCSMYS